MPKIFNLRTDPYERADVTSNTYYDWLLDHVFLLVPAQDYVGKFLHDIQGISPAPEGRQLQPRRGDSQNAGTHPLLTQPNRIGGRPYGFSSGRPCRLGRTVEWQQSPTDRARRDRSATFWCATSRKTTVIVIDVMALIIGTAEAFFTGPRAALAPGTSLALAINAAQERIFNAIDGNCSSR